jgi:hypothetical protein
MADELALLKDEIGDLVKQLQHEAQVAILEELRDMLEKEIDEGDLVRTDPTPPPRAEPKRRRAPSSKAGVNGRARDDLKDDEFIAAVGAGHVCGIDGCDFVGKTGQGLANHRSRKHQGTGEFPCSVEGCAHVSQTKSGLVIHDRRKHRGGGGVFDEADRWKDPGETGVCDVKDGRCDGDVSEWSCKHGRIAGCKFVARRCQAHRGDSSCRMVLGHHYRHHDKAGHDAPVDFGG